PGLGPVAPQGVVDDGGEVGVGGGHAADRLVPQGEAGVGGEGGGDVGPALGAGVEVAGVGAEAPAGAGMEAAGQQLGVVEDGAVGGRGHDRHVVAGVVVDDAGNRRLGPEQGGDRLHGRHL